MNPGGSVKDRAELCIILDAESTGRLRPGDTNVEGTAGSLCLLLGREIPSSCGTLCQMMPKLDYEKLRD